MRIADFRDYEAMLDGLAPSPPNCDLVAYDTSPHEQTERSLSNLFTAFAATLLEPVVEPAVQVQVKESSRLASSS